MCVRYLSTNSFRQLLALRNFPKNARVFMNIYIEIFVYKSESVCVYQFSGRYLAIAERAAMYIRRCVRVCLCLCLRLRVRTILCCCVHFGVYVYALV